MKISILLWIIAIMAIYSLLQFAAACDRMSALNLDWDKTILRRM